jgi:hypothetical protein
MARTSIAKLLASWALLLVANKPASKAARPQTKALLLFFMACLSQLQISA